MAYRVDEYKAVVRQDYKLRKVANGFRHNLIHPTAANLKDEALHVCSNRFEKTDEHILIKFFESQKDQQAYIAAINKTDPDDFKPLLNFLRGKTENPEMRQVELLAWLTDFKDRPYQHYIIVNPDGAPIIIIPPHTTPPTGNADNEQAQHEVKKGSDKTKNRPEYQKKHSMLWKYAALILLVSPLALLLPGQKQAPRDSVYICDSQGAKRYHLRKNCSGLRNCKHQIILIGLDSAKRTGRTLCHLEGGN